MRNIDLFKAHIKDIANRQKLSNDYYRKARKQTFVKGSIEKPADMKYYGWELRHMYMAYGLLRGRKPEQMEQKTRPDTPKLSEGLIQDYMDKYAWSEEEIFKYTGKMKNKVA